MKKLKFTTIFFCLTKIGFSQCDFTLSYDNPACAGACNGIIGVNTTTGTAPFSFNWSTGSTNFYIDDLCQGSYTLTMTDDLGCVFTDSVILIDPPVDTTFSVDVSYFAGTSAPGWCDGEIVLSVQGGTPGFTYYWKVCSTQQPVWPDPYFCSGQYYCVAEDDNGCLDSTECITISDPVADIQEVEAHIYADIYPNPAEHFQSLSVVLAQPSNGTIQLLDLTGRVVIPVYDGPFSNGETVYKVDVSALPGGIYIYKIASADGGVVYQKILKQ